MTEWRVISGKRESKARARRNAAADVRSDTDSDTDADAGVSAGRSCKVTSQLPRVVNSEIRNPKFEIRNSKSVVP